MAGDPLLDTPDPEPIPQPVPVPPPVPVEPAWDTIGRIASRKQQLLQTSMLAAAQTTPDKHIEAIRLARGVGVAPAAVASDLDHAKQLATVHDVDYQGLVARHPELSNWLSNHDNAAVAQDDIPGLRSMDHEIAALTQPRSHIPLPEGYIYGKGGTIVEVGANGYGTEIGSEAALIERLKERQDLANLAQYERDKARAELSAQFGGHDWLAQFATGALQNAERKVQTLQRLIGTDTDPSTSRMIEEQAQAASDLAGDNFVPKHAAAALRGLGSLAADAPLLVLGGSVGKGVESLLAIQKAERAASAIEGLTPILGAESLTPIAAKVAQFIGTGKLKTAVTTAATMAPIALPGAIETAQDHGAINGAIDFLINTAVPGAATAGFGRFGLTKALLGAEAETATSKLATAGGFSGMASRLAREAGLQGGLQTTQTLASALHERVSGIDPTALDADKLASRLFDAGVIGGTTGLLFGLPHEVRGRAVREAIAGEHSLTFAQQLARTVDSVKARTLTERSPELMQELQGHLIGDGERSVYFNAGEWEQHWRALGEAPYLVAKRMGALESYQLAKATGGDIQVPIPAFLVEAAKAKDPSALITAARQVPGARSAAEVVKIRDQTLPEIQKLAKETAAAAKAGPDALSPGAKRVMEDVAEQMRAAGEDPGAIERNALVTAAYFDTQAKRLNEESAKTGEAPVDPFDRYQASGLNIQRVSEITRTAAAAQLEQAHSVLNAPGESLAFRDLVDQWREAHGEEPETGSPTWRELEKQAREIDAAQGKEYHQEREPSKALGSFSPATNRIKLTDNANLTTYLHELGHFMFEDMGRLVRSGAAPQSIKDDHAKILEHLGVKDGAEPTEKQLEAFARTVESYFLTGKAPSAALRPAFSRIKAWFLDVYRRVKGALGDPQRGLEIQAGQRIRLSEEVRGVFDRLLATDDAIAAAQEEMGTGETLPRESFANDKDFAAYQKAAAASRRDATDKLQAELVREFRREQTKQYQRERGEVRATVADEVNQRREYVAISILQSSAMPDGRSLPDDLQGIKLNKRMLMDSGYTADDIRKLPGPQHAGAKRANSGAYVYSEDGGVSLPVAADLLGFKSPAELWEALTTTPDRIDRIEAETDGLMRERHPDPFLHGNLEEMAADALHNEQAGKALQAEIRSLGIRTGNRPAPVEILRETARGIIDDMPVRDIRPELYRIAEARAARRAFDAATIGNHEQAYAEKQRQALNGELYRAARDRVEAVEAGSRYLREIEKPAARERIGKAGGWEWTVTFPDGTQEHTDSEAAARDLGRMHPGSQWARSSSYVQQIDGILDHFELRTVPIRTLAKRMELLDWVAAQEAQNLPVDIPQSVLRSAQSINWKELPSSDFVDIVDAVKNIEALARLKNHILNDRAKRTMEQAQNDAALVIESNARGERKNTVRKSVLRSTAEGFGQFFAAHRKMASLLTTMEGGNHTGLLWDLLMRPLNESADAEAVMNEQATTKLHEAFTTWGKSLGLDAFTARMVPEVGEALSRVDRLMVALNWGNAGNREWLTKGHGWDAHTQVQPILDSLDKSDLTLAQAILDIVNDHWSEIAAKQERVYGVAPEKVEALPIVAAAGTIPGGYFPVIQSTRVGENFDLQAQAKQTMQGIQAKATTRRGHTNARKGWKQGQRLSLEFGNIARHITQVIHDLTHHEMLINGNRFLADDSKITKAIAVHYGQPMVEQLRATLADVAAGTQGIQDATDRFIGNLRRGVPIAALAFNATSAVTNLTGITQSVVRIGPEAMARGVARIFRDATSFSNTMGWVTEKSDAMRLRFKTFNREVNEIANRIKLGSDLKGKYERAAYWLMAQTQKAVDLPTWVGQYEKSMAEGHDEAMASAHADQAVIDAQGSGLIKDLASVQRGNVWKKLFTTLYGYANTTFNLTAESVSRYRRKPLSPMANLRLVSDLLLLYAVPTALTMAIKDHLRGHKPEKPGEYAARLGQEVAVQLASSMVGAREVAAGLSGHDYQGPAGTRGLEIITGAVKRVRQAKGTKGTTAALASGLGDAAAIWFHLPTVQAKRVLDGILYDSQHHSVNPLPLVTGPPPKR